MNEVDKLQAALDTLIENEPEIVADCGGVEFGRVCTAIRRLINDWLEIEETDE